MTTTTPSARRTAGGSVLARLARAIPVLAIGSAAMVQAASPAPRQQGAPKKTAASRTVVDHAVQPAGGCRDCGPAGCSKHSHHRDCRDGHCSPSCPVRPTTFGYYGTQWRRWPGEGVVPASFQDAATPAKPPRSAVPSADEESFAPPAAPLPEPDFPQGGNDAAGMEPAEPREPDAAQEPRAMPLDEPVAPVPTEPAAIPRDDRPAEAAPARPRPEDTDLFDDSAARPMRRPIPGVGTASTAGRTPSQRVQPVAHERGVVAPAKKAVPRVAFDPRQETARLRQQAR